MRIFLITILLLFAWAGSEAQSRADRLFERGDYLGALKAYQKDLELVGENAGEKSDLLKMRVANCFFRLNDVVRSGQVYKKVNPDLMDAENLTFYAITLLRSGEYDKAAEQIDLVESLGGDEAVVERLRGSCEFAKEVVKEKPLYTANKMKINFSGFSAGVTYYKGKSIILAAPGTGKDALTDSRGYKVTRLYNAIFTGDGTSGRLIPFAEGLCDKYHIGAVTFTRDFKRIYYTRTILKKDGTSILKLMTAEEVGGKWENIEELSINSDDYSCAHPCLYRDSLLFFVSDMPGGVGGKDIYMATVQGAECGEVQNLGETINTVFDELFPVMSDDGHLYFASNGHVGLGGLDVFVTEMQSDGSWAEPQNMGRPINSSMDDFGLVFKDTKCTEGYVSSNRGGTGYNDFLFALKLLPNRKREMVKPEKIQQVVPSDEMFAVDYRYAIQIGAFRNPVPRVYFENFQNVKVYLGFDNIYRYTVGEYPEEGIARNELGQVRRMIGDAFVISVDKYVAQKKIQHDVKGDDIADNELLIRRLKNFERMKNERSQAAYHSTKRYIDKPKDDELHSLGNGYTIVLMSADRVLDLSEFKGVDEVDVYAVQGGKYMYCSGMYATPEQAMPYLTQMKSRGFHEARIIKSDTYEYYTEQKPQTSPVNRNITRRDPAALKQLLNF